MGGGYLPERRLCRVNLPNRLTISRLVLTVAFLVCLMSPARVPYGGTLALLLFIAASLTDFFDGRIARRDNLITNFGILMDPLADKILICSAFIAFVDLRLMPAWMVVVIVCRELTITGLRLLAISKHVVLAAAGYGKHKTASQILTIIFMLIFISYPQWGAWARDFFSPWIDPFTHILQWIAVLLTLLSGGIYLWRNRAMYMTDI
jgi:CDP-diacylglycerol--glycerol-3-phosphate 3-phosphatidyltransferase